jgi:hypothetical protein
MRRLLLKPISKTFTPYTIRVISQSNGMQNCVKRIVVHNKQRLEHLIVEKVEKWRYNQLAFGVMYPLMNRKFMYRFRCPRDQKAWEMAQHNCPQQAS